MPSRARDVVLISGIVATIQIIARSDGNDELIFRVAQQNRLFLMKNINQQIYETLGDGYFLYDLNIREGSVHFWIMIGTRAAQVLNAFSRYDALLKSFDRLKDQIRETVQGFLSDDPQNRVTARLSGTGAEPYVQAVWLPGESINAAAERFGAQHSAGDKASGDRRKVPQ
jgi:hypothetical protein